jgi:hypothetical protein
MLAASELFTWQDIICFGRAHHVTPQFFVVHVKNRMHELNCSHLFDVVDSCFLQDFYVCDQLPGYAKPLVCGRFRIKVSILARILLCDAALTSAIDGPEGSADLSFVLFHPCACSSGVAMIGMYPFFRTISGRHSS